MAGPGSVRWPVRRKRAGWGCVEGTEGVLGEVRDAVGVGKVPATEPAACRRDAGSPVDRGSRLWRGRGGVQRAVIMRNPPAAGAPPARTDPPRTGALGDRPGTGAKKLR